MHCLRFEIREIKALAQKYSEKKEYFSKETLINIAGFNNGNLLEHIGFHFRTFLVTLPTAYSVWRRDTMVSHWREEEARSNQGDRMSLRKNRPNFCPTFFVKTNTQIWPWKKYPQTLG
jgi:hypothetical protein